MADKQAEIQALQWIVTALSNQSFGHRIQGLVFGSKGNRRLLPGRSLVEYHGRAF